MKKVIAIVKKRWVPIVCGLVVLVSLGAGWIISNNWNKRIREQQARKAQEAMTALTGSRVTYGLPPPGPGLQAVSLSTEPNRRITEYFAEHKARIEGDSARIIDLAFQHNLGLSSLPPRPSDPQEQAAWEREAISRSRFAPLIPGLFPMPRAGEENRLVVQFAKSLIGEPGTLSAYEKLLASIRAGRPMSRAQLARDLEEQKLRITEQMKGPQPNRELTPEERDQLEDRLRGYRLASERRRASEISTFAGVEVLPRQIPREIPAEPPSVEQCFLWQADYWIVAQYLDTIRAANTPPGAREPVSVDRALVKRLYYIQVPPIVALREVPEFTGGEEEGMENFSRPGQSGGPPNDGSGALFEPRFGQSITGRSGRNNGLYEIRYGHMEVAVEAARLPQFLDVISSSNFMTVTDVDIYQIDVWDDLRQGFYYGEEPVVRVHVEIETIWLKNWLAHLAPGGLRADMGLPALEGWTPPQRGRRDMDGFSQPRGRGRGDR